MTYLQATFEDKFEYNQAFTKYSFELKMPHYLPFKAGQFVRIKLADQVEQPYFIFSSPAIDHGFEILVDMRVEGIAKSFFSRLQFGQAIEFLGPEGDFVIEPLPAKELIMIGDQVGVAPLYSQLQDLLQVKNFKNKITLYWGLETLDELFMTDDFSDLVAHFPNFNFHPVIGSALPEWTLCRGSVLDCLNVHEVSAESEFYICTNSKLAEKITNLCLASDVQATQLHVATYA